LLRLVLNIAEIRSLRIVVPANLEVWTYQHVLSYNVLPNLDELAHVGTIKPLRNNTLDAYAGTSVAGTLNYSSHLFTVFERVSVETVMATHKGVSIYTIYIQYVTCI